MQTDSPIGQRWAVLADALDERQRRLLAGVEAKVLGRGGISAVALATGISRVTIMAGISEIEAMKSIDLPADQLATPKTTGTRQAGVGADQGSGADRLNVAPTLPHYVWVAAPRGANPAWCGPARAN